MRRAITFLLLALLVADALALVPGARANLNRYTAVWDSTTAWDGGAKAAMDTATNSCLASGQGIQLNATGGFYGVSRQCPGGTPLSIGPVLNSWNGRDKRTVNGVSLLQDEGVADNALTFFKVVNVTDGPFGGGGVYLTANGVLQTASPFNHNVSLNVITFFAWVKTNSSGTCGSNLCTLFNAGTQNPAAGFILTYWDDSAGSGSITYQYSTGAVTSNVVLGTVLNDGHWHGIGIRANYTTGKVQSYVDGTASTIQTMTTPLIPSNNLALFVGTFQGSVLRARVSFSDFGIVYGWASNTEMTRLTTVGHYAASGSWTSPKIQTTNQTPVAAVLGYRNVSGSQSFGPWVKGFSVFNSTTGLRFDSPGVMATGTYNVTYFTVSVVANGSQIVPHRRLNWTLEIDLQGDGNATAQVFFAAVIFQSLPAPTAKSLFGPTLDTNAWTFVMLGSALLFFLWLSYYMDSVLPFFPAAILAFLLGFAAWNIILPGGDPATAWMALVSFIGVGSIFLIIPIRAAFRGRRSVV